MSDVSDFMAKIREDFLDEALDLVESCEESFLRLDDLSVRDEELAKIFRAAHTIKGSGAAVGIVDLVEFAHVVEDCLAALRAHPEMLTVELTTLLLRSLDALREKIQILREGDTRPWSVAALVCELKEARGRMVGVPAPCVIGGGEGVSFGFFDQPEAGSAPATPTADIPEPPSSVVRSEPQTAARRESASIKIDPSRVDSLLDLVGELVVIKSQLINKTEVYASDAQLAAIVALLDKTVRELQDKTLAIRLTPVKPLFLKMQRLARDLAVKMGRALDFETGGDEIELDRTVVELLGDPLMHLVRNAVDHGVETPAARRTAGKPEKGTLRLAASQGGGRILVRLTDDGRGIDRAKVLAKAIERGLLPAGTDGRALSDQEVHKLILAPGFSTADQVTDVSGRGVGLDVVRTQIEKLKGELIIRSTAGEGTSFEISLPLTASVTDGMLVEVGASRFVVPMDRIRNLVKVDRAAIVALSADRDVLNVRGELMPLLDSQAFLTAGRSVATQTNDMAVVFDHNNRSYALRVGGILGQMQVVMKPLDAAFPRDVVAGAAILGDGEVALIADMDGLVRQYLQTVG